MDALDQILSPVKTELDMVTDQAYNVGSNSIDLLPLQDAQPGCSNTQTSCSISTEALSVSVMETDGTLLSAASTEVKASPNSMGLEGLREGEMIPHHSNSDPKPTETVQPVDSLSSGTEEKVSTENCDELVKLAVPKNVTVIENKTSVGQGVEVMGRDDQAKEETAVKGKVYQGKEETAVKERVDHGKEETAVKRRLEQGKEETAVKGRVDIRLQCPECSADNDFYVCKGTVRDDVAPGEKVKIHAGEKLMHCKNCNASFASCYAVVKPHSSVVEDAESKPKKRRVTRSSKAGDCTIEKPYKCEHCDKAFNYLYSFKVHLQTHTGQKSLKCSVCEAVFRRPHRLYEHMKSQHRDTVKLMKCSYCPKHFTSSEALNEHTRIHTMEKPYTCVYCPSSFKTRFDLDRHMLVHTGEKPYKCNQCSAAFKRPFSLSQHIKSQHTEGGKKPRQPSLKPRKKYTRRNDTRERPFKCQECDCAYMTAQKLKDHTILKHNAVDLKKTYACEQCSAVFRKYQT